MQLNKRSWTVHQQFMDSTNCKQKTKTAYVLKPIIGSTKRRIEEVNKNKHLIIYIASSKKNKQEEEYWSVLTYTRFFLSEMLGFPLGPKTKVVGLFTRTWNQGCWAFY